MICVHRWVALTPLLLVACPQGSPYGDKGSEKEATAKKSAAKKAADPTPPKPAPTTAPPAKAPPADGPMGKVSDGPVPILSILGKPPPEAQKLVGEHLGKGLSKKSCLRFVPDRTFFSCSFASQRYEDKTGTYKAIGIEYEDGKAVSLSFEGIPGEGPFDATKALTAVGLQLPGQPKKTSPAPQVDLYSWFNSAARLMINEQQYRVEVSVVEGQWPRSKVELILNSPLTPEQQARIVQPRTKEAKP